VDFCTFSVSTKRVHSRGGSFGELGTEVSASIQSSLFSSSDTFLAVRAGSCVVINVYLPPNYKNDESEQLFAQAFEILHTRIRQVQNLISLVLLFGIYCEINFSGSAVSLRASIFRGIFLIS
jgi:hypothetical protein